VAIGWSHFCWPAPHALLSARGPVKILMVLIFLTAQPTAQCNFTIFLLRIIYFLSNEFTLGDLTKKFYIILVLNKEHDFQLPNVLA